MEKLPGDYIAGFVDGEGCFALKFVRSVRYERPNKPVYFYWAIEFAIVLRADDVEILEGIRYTLDCGTVRPANKAGCARLSVAKWDDLSSKVVPFFEKYPLRAKKRKDYLLWKEALSILIKNKQVKAFKKITMSDVDLARLKEIHTEMGEFKSNVKEWKWLKEVDSPFSSVTKE
ncbi:MAG TPA: LAGLIDADG family homing endonuclease [Candidatus Paceibacterota bacterium]|nr:LAGLIDADG family homing endonuclease [Candidatus Paceibacterota bacterium]